MVPVVGGHFGEGNAELMDLIKRIARVLSASKWKQLGFKGPKGGVAPAEAGITRRVGLALDRANAQRVARCVVSQVEGGDERTAHTTTHTTQRTHSHTHMCRHTTYTMIIQVIMYVTAIV